MFVKHSFCQHCDALFKRPKDAITHLLELLDQRTNEKLNKKRAHLKAIKGQLREANVKIANLQENQDKALAILAKNEIKDVKCLVSGISKMVEEKRVLLKRLKDQKGNYF